MAYDKCVGYEGFECPVIKTGGERRYARCKSCAKKGNTNGAALKGRTKSPEHRANISSGKTGITRSPEHCRNLSLAHGGNGDVENRLYHGLGRWTRLVKERDGRCTMCGTVENLEAHHIISKTTRPELATVLENGLTLCAGCHRTEPWAVHKQSFNFFP